jgi:diguanylate cyclase (GGDEF)-like protein
MLNLPVEKLQGSPLEPLVLAEDQQDLHSAIGSVLAGTKPEATVSVRLLPTVGEPFWAEVYALPASPAETSVISLFVHRVEEDLQAIELLNRRTREQVALLHLQRELLQERDLQNTLNMIAEQARLLLNALDCTVFLLQPDGKKIRAVAASGSDSLSLLSTRAQIGEGLTGWVIEHGVPQRLEAVEGDVRGPRGVGLPDSGSLLCGPLVYGEHSLGAILLRGEPGRFTDTDLEFLAGLAQVASLAITHSRVFDEAQRAGTIDDLTGAYNRSFLHTNLPVEINLARRLGHGVGLLLLDVDGLRSFNAEAGHLAGDALLAALVQVVNRIIRETDWVARFDGDEFAVVLPGCPAEQLGVIADRLQREFSQAVLAVPQVSQAPVSLSIGGSVYPECMDDPNGLLQDADLAEGEAKRAGAGQVVIRPRRSPPNGATPPHVA